MRNTTIVLIMLLSSFNLQAYSNFIENPYSPYPPGCATLPGLQTELYGDNVVKVAEQEIEIWSTDASLNELLPVNLAVYRIVCPDPGSLPTSTRIFHPRPPGSVTNLLRVARG